MRFVLGIRLAVLIMCITFSASVFASPAWAETRMIRLHVGKTGLSFIMPADWKHRVNRQKDLIITGPDGSSAKDMLIAVQTIDKGLAKATLIGEMQSTLSQASQIKGSEIKTKSTVTLAGKEAPYFLAAYPDSGGKPRVYLQIGLEHSNYVFLISCSAPEQVYKENLPWFEKIVGSAKFQ